MGPSFPLSSDADFQLCLQPLSLLSPVLLTCPPFLGTWNTLSSFWLILIHPSSLSGCPTLWHLPHCGYGHATCRSWEHLSCLLWSPRIQPMALSTYRFSVPAYYMKEQGEQREVNKDDIGSITLPQRSSPSCFSRRSLGL